MVLEIERTNPEPCACWASTELYPQPSFHLRQCLSFQADPGHSVAQADLEPAIFLPQPLTCWDDRCETLIFFMFSSVRLICNHLCVCMGVGAYRGQMVVSCHVWGWGLNPGPLEEQ